MKKKVYTVLIAALTLLVLGCEDFLDRKPLGRYTTETYPTGGLTQFIYGMYSDLRLYGVHAWPYVGVVSIRSDDADKGSTPTDGAQSQAPYDDFTLLPNHGLTLTFYRDNYRAINKCNVVLQQSDSLRSEISEEEYNMARAEARFVRGYLYFNLVRAFGGVPKVDDLITDSDNFNVPRASKEEIYTLIEQDLLYAAGILPPTWGAAFIGRPTRGSAQGLLAKVYLYQQRWAESLQMSQNVIASGFYNLNTPYNVIFTEAGENTSESVFEIQAIRNESYNFGIEYVVGQGIRGTGAMDLGWGFNSPSVQLVNAYESGDPRQDHTILFQGEVTPYGEIVPPLDGVPNVRYNQKVYTNPTYRAAAGSRFGHWMNVRILRYADVLLMAAEAANELNQTSNALDYLEQVRARARGGNASVLPQITETNQALLRDHIRHERRIELAMEHERFFDIVRWGIAETVLHAAGKTNFVVGKHELLPIPQEEIDRSDGVLIQNPGY
ncbi:MAG: RagB/SusD family nutrient uptake outer membrane protein [Cyclobacteriaceae bacterium]|nr:RagB/SusD family nutrient uptake outer membrane protein [Cyclobacteriaceae bacterium]